VLRPGHQVFHTGQRLLSSRCPGFFQALYDQSDYPLYGFSIRHAHRFRSGKNGTGNIGAINQIFAF
jgi:hypothetical protein